MLQGPGSFARSQMENENVSVTDPKSLHNFLFVLFTGEVSGQKGFTKCMCVCVCVCVLL